MSRRRFWVLVVVTRGLWQHDNTRWGNRNLIDLGVVERLASGSVQHSQAFKLFTRGGDFSSPCSQDAPSPMAPSSSLVTPDAGWGRHMARGSDVHSVQSWRVALWGGKQRPTTCTPEVCPRLSWRPSSYATIHKRFLKDLSKHFKIWGMGMCTSVQVATKARGVRFPPWSCLTWVLGTDSGPLGRAVNSVHHWAIYLLHYFSYVKTVLLQIQLLTESLENLVNYSEMYTFASSVCMS